MKRSDRLQPVLKLAKTKALQGAKAMAYMTNKLEQEQTRLQQLVQYQDEYRQGLVDAGKRGISAQDFKLYANFTETVETAITHQQNQIAHVNRQLLQVKQYWQTLDAKHKGLGKMLDKIHRQELRTEERNEQKEMEEFRRPRF